MENFQIWQKDKKTDKSPDYELVHYNGETNEYIGVAWKKVTKEGKPYLSCQMSKEYNGKPGYKIIKTDATAPGESQESNIDDSIPF